MNMIEEIINGKEKLSVVGLGYVGLPLAIAFADAGLSVIGFDVNDEKIKRYRDGDDPTGEVGRAGLANTSVKFTSDEKDLRNAKFHIVAVPTPINPSKLPDLQPVETASHIVGRNLGRGSIVVYESTVYPGVTEEICVPILEQASGMKCGVDFKVGYSPERINPGDKINTIDKIVKIVSGMDDSSLEIIAGVYEAIIKAGVFKAPSIKVAEAAKVVENAQRDINIAFMNELSMIFDRMGIDTREVLAAAGSKWNFLKFTPGLVGGHCIGVDPYYLAYSSEKMGHSSQLILAGRRINESMGKYVAEKTVKKIIENNIDVKKAIVLILGITFKENVPDIRNSKVFDVIKELENYGVKVQVVDPKADTFEAEKENGISLVNLIDVKDVDAIILAVNHQQFCEIGLAGLRRYYKKNLYKPILIDVKGVFDRQAAERDYSYWRL